MGELSNTCKVKWVYDYPDLASDKSCVCTITDLNSSIYDGANLAIETSNKLTTADCGTIWEGNRTGDYWTVSYDSCLRETTAEKEGDILPKCKNIKINKANINKSYLIKI